MKIILLAIVLICCFIIAIKIKSFFLIKHTFFKKLLFFCQNMQNSISYQKEKIVCIIDKEFNFNKSDKNFRVFLGILKRYFNCDLTRDEFKKILTQDLFFLNSIDIDVIYNFFISFGNSFQEEELNKINNFKHYLNSCLIKSDEFNKKYVSLYFKLFIIFGIMLFIIFI